MITVPITWIDDSPRMAAGASAAIREDSQRFIEEVGRFAGVSIPLVEGLLKDVAPPDGIILLRGGHPVVALDECPAERRAHLARRLVPIGGDRIRVFEKLLEPLSLPALVDSMTLMEWRSSDRDKPGAYGPYGRRDIGALVGAGCMLFESARYCYLHSPTHFGLPHLLADYLTAYASAVLASS